jgi:hypothetical protein
MRGTPIGIARLSLACVPAAGLFLAQFLTLYASMGTSTFMQTYWGEFFVHPPVGTAIREAVGLGRLVWIFLLLGSASEPMLPAKTLTVLLLLWIGGIAALLRRGVLPVAVLLAPLVLTFVAALMERWPLAPRLLLFLAPTMLLPLGAGVGAANSLLPKRARRPVFALAAGALMLPVALGAGRVLLEPPEFTPLPAALEAIAAEPGAASVAYISPALVPPCRWYQFRSGRAEVGSALPECFIDGVTTVTGRDPAYPERGGVRHPAELLARRTEWAAAELTRLQPLVKGELWVVMWKGTSVREPISPALEQAGARLLESRTFDTVELYRYNLAGR